MPAIRETLLCAALTGDAKALKAAGRGFAEGALGDALEALRSSARARGRLVGALSDRILVAYATPDSAAGAAVDMADAIDALPPFAGTHLRARIAFHCATASTQRDDDAAKLVFGLVAQAQPGQILTTQATAELIGTSYRAFSSRLQAAPLGRSGPQASIYEILGREAR